MRHAESAKAGQSSQKAGKSGGDGGRGPSKSGKQWDVRKGLLFEKQVDEGCFSKSMLGAAASPALVRMHHHAFRRGEASPDHVLMGVVPRDTSDAPNG